MGSWPNWLQNIYIIEEQIKNSWNRVEHLITHCYTSIEQANKLDFHKTNQHHAELQIRCKAW